LLRIKVFRFKFEVPRFLRTKVMWFLGIEILGFQDCLASEINGFEVEMLKISKPLRSRLRYLENLIP
jgi:hypothetical protein